MKPTNSIAVIAAALTTLGLGIGMYFVSKSPYLYGEPEMAYVLWWVQILLVVIALIFTFKYFTWKSVGFDKLNKKHLWWLVPYLIFVFLMVGFAFDAYLIDPNLVLLLLFVTFLVGFGEELMYRGVVLRTFINNMSPRKAIFYSAILFSLLHSVNIIAGSAIVSQLIFTFTFGLFAGGLMLLLRNMWPLILVHWFHNFFLISILVLGDSINLTNSIIIYSYGLTIYSVIFGFIFLFKANKWFPNQSNN